MGAGYEAKGIRKKGSYDHEVQWGLEVMIPSTTRFYLSSHTRMILCCESIDDAFKLDMEISTRSKWISYPLWMRSRLQW